VRAPPIQGCGLTRAWAASPPNVLEWRMSCVNQAAQIGPLFLDQRPRPVAFVLPGLGEAGAAAGEAVGSGEQRGILHGLFTL
jgi:hypothetical protein